MVAFNDWGRDRSCSALWPQSDHHPSLNNGGWGIFRPIAKRQDLLALPSWHYAELARLWGGQGYKVKTSAELRGAMEEAAGSSQFAIIELSIGPRDLSPITMKYISASAKKAQMNSGT
jgi:thiamine pyrophosphate-dependent acetolactate synthase large subunit-like protein